MVDADGRRRTTDGRRLNGYTISSSCEPKGSGELKISEKLQENDWEQELHGLSLSETWEILTEKLVKLIEENVPVRKVSNGAGRKNPYVSQQCMEAIWKKHTKWQKYLHNKTEENYTQ